MKRLVITVLIFAGLVFFDTFGSRTNANPLNKKDDAAVPPRLFAGPNDKRNGFPDTAPIKKDRDDRSLNFRTAGIFAAGSPYPRVITPNEDGVNDYVFFFFETTDASADGRIYDLNSALVASMKPGPNKTDLMSLIWDGKDDRGHVVPMGVYLYKVTIGNESVTGTIVVAR
jgi:hypothetical protein